MRGSRGRRVPYVNHAKVTLLTGGSLHRREAPRDPRPFPGFWGLTFYAQRASLKLVPALLPPPQARGGVFC
jgi:hypothetical protein